MIFLSRITHLRIYLKETIVDENLLQSFQIEMYSYLKHKNNLNIQQGNIYLNHAISVQGVTEHYPL